MSDDLDALLKAQGLAPPAGFAARVAALAKTLPQAEAPERAGFWHWASLAAGAGAGLVLLAEFALFAFASVGAQ